MVRLGRGDVPAGRQAGLRHGQDQRLLGACDVAVVRYLLGEAALHKARPTPVDVGELARYDRPMPSVADYDTLLVSSPCAGRA